MEIIKRGSIAMEKVVNWNRLCKSYVSRVHMVACWIDRWIT